MGDVDTSALLKRVERLEAIEAIETVMGRRAYLHSAGLYEREIGECWSLERDDIEFEPVQLGAWAGRETVTGVLTGLAGPDGVPPGHMFEHALSTRLIEVAADGQTAIGLWISPGHETYRPFGSELPKATWNWCRYSVDFVKEKAGWRIWHVRIFNTFNTPYDQDWVDVIRNPPAGAFDMTTLPPGMPALARKTGYASEYRPDHKNLRQPLPPEPYDTWPD